MKFQLKPDNRNSSDEDLIKDLVSVAKKLAKNTLTRNEYSKHGRYSGATLQRRFGNWRKALGKAGFSQPHHFASDRSFITDEQLIQELKRVAELPDVKVLSKTIFNKYKSIPGTAARIESRFGTWSKALKKAGLSVLPSQNRYSNEELFQNLLNVWTHYSRQPTVTEMSELPSKITPNTYSNRFGNWRKALEAFVEYANQGEQEAFDIKKIDKPKLEQTELIPDYARHKTSRGINVRLRFIVMKRDNFKCKNCGRSPATDLSIILHVDHIKAWANGGETVLENLQTLCSVCNIGKSDLE